LGERLSGSVRRQALLTAAVIVVSLRGTVPEHWAEQALYWFSDTDYRATHTVHSVGAARLDVGLADLLRAVERLGNLMLLKEEVLSRIEAASHW
jgi:hypothetical protein